MKTGVGVEIPDEQARVLLEQTVWLPQRGALVPLQEPGSAVLQASIRKGLWVLAFTSLELAVGAELDQDDVFPTCLWDALRRVPLGSGLVVDPGQGRELWVADGEIDGLLGGPRQAALPLSPAGLARWAGMSASVQIGRDNGFIGAASPPNTMIAWRDPRDAAGGLPEGGQVCTGHLGALAQAIPSTAQLILDPGSMQHYFDQRFVAALARAYGMFPAGCEVALAPVLDVFDDPAVRQFHERAPQLLTPQTAADGWLLAYQTPGATARLLLVIRTGDGPLAPACVAAFDQWLAQHQLPAQLWQMQWPDLPPEVQQRLDDDGDLAASRLR